MKLSVCIVVCDRDVDVLSSFLKEVAELVKVEHEVLVWDNTENKSLPVLPKDVSVFYTGQKYNWAQFVGRRELVRAARGDWIWFVDPDDHLCRCITDEAVADYTSSGVECVVFQFSNNSVSDKLFGLKNDWATTKERDIVNYRNLFSYVTDSLWNKWFNRLALLDAYTPVNDIVARISVHEDTLLHFLFFVQDRVVSFSRRCIYEYNDAGSTAGEAATVSTFDQFQKYIYGFKLATGLILRVVPDIEKLDEAFYEEYGEEMEKAWGRVAAKKCMEAALSDPGNLKNLADALVTEMTVEDALYYMRAARAALPLDSLVRWVELEETFSRRVALHRVPRVTITLHPDCDVDCPYCNRREALAEERKHRLTDDEMLDRFRLVIGKLKDVLPFGFIPQIMGGEPGCWSEYFDRKLAAELEEFPSYIVFTNGNDRNNFWYKQERASTITHLIDWAGRTESSMPVTPRDCTVIVITHKDLPKLEDYLKINKDPTLQIAPCDGAGEEWDINGEDAKKLVALQVKYKLSWVGHTGVDVPAIQGSTRCDTLLDPPWQVDCNSLMAATCTKSRKWVSLDELTQDTAVSCMGCQLTAF